MEVFEDAKWSEESFFVENISQDNANKLTSEYE
jgi:hypothetical protein